ncbi:TIGR03862 family flavoprotein [Hymenobacter metallicola]|uniref:TIGR03862 family flavoprotein n=1 Tax=Hymenobacter metallicola TaxID=2563114 RepID=A0A4Z0QE59_9BACT|nr:TIGR03862 family flavoprotein [Hymenobacter metallicola]TGE28347.1 TIGR03862 family flavoprotein [Hymenobacter metallicola]
MPSEIAVIGGGPAGLLAAQRLAEAGYYVTIYDAQPTVGRKFLVAGHGGFNLSNAEPLPTFEQRYGDRHGHFRDFLSYFSPTALRDWLQSLGISTFVGTSGRIFPTDDYKPAHVLRAWLNRLHTLGVQIKTRHRWLGFAPNQGLQLHDEATSQPLTIYPAATVLALGGASWTKTGSDGQWTTALTRIGIRCVPFGPSNCGAEVAWSAFFREKVGRAPLKNIALQGQGQTVRGELMLTEYGLEGTPVYALTPGLRRVLATQAPAELLLNLKPDLSPEQVYQKLQAPRKGKSLAAYLEKTLRLGPPVPTLLRELAPPAADATPQALAELLQRLPIPVSGLRPLEEAISTAGGVAWEEVNEHLMLQRRPGVFVAGEMLDWEAPTGGYLLQGCFSTGAWAARGIDLWLRHQQ